MLDQSPHQLARARAKPALRDCAIVRGDAERLPFATDGADRYVSAGSIEYWPDPQRGIAEAYRVLRPGGVAVVAGPVRPRHPVARRLADAWMLFPPEEDYLRWFGRAGFRDVEVRRVAPAWYSGAGAAYAVAVAGTKPAPGESPVGFAGAPEAPDEAMTPRRWVRFAAGSLAGLAFVPIALALTLRRRVLAARRGA
jgi:MPBQ/MSBQ methyltransferase